ncbi:MAG: iron ABC transporter permease [Fimbriimonadaceae bacterium]|nr:iron ABC transporter permease [Fimbriimonadaceae bacterium]
MPDFRPPSRWGLGLFAAVLFVVILVHLAIGGSASISVGEIFSALLAGPGTGSTAQTILWEIRLPRVIAATVAGIGLAIVGSAFQPVLRNPLADPFVLGASSGAAVGGTLSLALGLPGIVGFVLSTGGALLALLFVLAIAGKAGSMSVDRLIVAGVVTGTLLSAVLMLILTFSGHDPARLMRWLFGSTTPAFWDRTAIMTLAVGLGLFWFLAQRRSIDALAFGDDEAQSTGVSVAKTRTPALFCGAVVTGAIVGSVGIVGFIGLVAPHIARRLVGAPIGRSLPTSALVGGALMVGSDLLAQQLLPGREIPLGVVTALLGAPVLLALLRRR